MKVPSESECPLCGNPLQVVSDAGFEGYTVESEQRERVEAGIRGLLRVRTFGVLFWRCRRCGYRWENKQ